MKILWCLSCYNGLFKQADLSISNNPDIVYGLLWQNFIKRIKSPWDFLLLTTGFNKHFLHNNLPDCNYYSVPSFPISGDTRMTFMSCIQGDKYDYAVRCDQDAFISQDWINRVDKFLNENPDVNILSSVNVAQPTMPIGIAAGDQRFREDNKHHIWEPWGVPTVGDCIVFIKQDLFRAAYEEWSTNPLFAKSGARCEHDPFSQSTITYGEVCEYLEHKPRYKDLDPDTILHIDGQISVDFWTAMAKVGIRHAGITNWDGRTFNYKENLNFFDQIITLHNGNFDAIVDDNACAARIVKKYKNIAAPYFHIGASYLTSLCFKTLNNPAFGQDLLDQLRSSGIWLNRMVMAGILAKYSGSKELMEVFKNNTPDVLEWLQISTSEFEQRSNALERVYGPVLGEYRSIK